MKYVEVLKILKPRLDNKEYEVTEDKVYRLHRTGKTELRSDQVLDLADIKFANYVFDSFYTLQQAVESFAKQLKVPEEAIWKIHEKANLTRFDLASAYALCAEEIRDCY